MVGEFNKHLFCAGSVFDSSDVNISVPCFGSTEIDGNLELFDFKPIPVAQVCKALKATNISYKKSAGPDSLDPYLFKMAADIIAEPIYSSFLSLPKIWKAAYVLPLFKG